MDRSEASGPFVALSRRRAKSAIRELGLKAPTWVNLPTTQTACCAARGAGSTPATGSFRAHQCGDSTSDCVTVPRCRLESDHLSAGSITTKPVLFSADFSFVE